MFLDKVSYEPAIVVVIHFCLCDLLIVSIFFFTILNVNNLSWAFASKKNI